MSNEVKTKTERLLAIVQEALAKDEELRTTYQVKDKFRFIRERLQYLLTRVEENLKNVQEAEEKHIDELSQDEQLVYIYLFNAQGIHIESWHKMLQPGVFYEYSINRPIYQDRKYVENIIKTKSNRQQHGFIIIAQNKNDIISGQTQDALMQPLIRVRDGSLNPKRVHGFVHNGQEYALISGKLVPKLQ